MKKLLTIFSVFLICNGIFCPNSFATKNCELDLCDMGSDTSELLSKDGQTKNSDFKLEKSSDLKGQMCFHCDIGDGGDRNCPHNAFVATVSSNDRKMRVFKCSNDSGVDDSWEVVHIDTMVVCSTSELPLTGISNATCIVTDNGEEIKMSRKVERPCLMCSCNPGYRVSGDTCVLDTSGEETCENSPSYGQWQNNTCVCNKEGQKDKEPGKTCECQPGLAFDESHDKCVNPNQSAIDDCVNSGGEWNTAVTPNKCVCSVAKGFDETPVNGQCVCKNPGEEYDGTRCVPTEQAICTNSGGDWDGSTCTCDSAKHLKEKTGIIPARCECENDRYEPYPDKKKGCKLTEQAQRDDVLNKDCYDSGGVWQGQACICDASDGLRTENNICVCLDDRYSRSKSNPRKCELTDLAMAEKNCDDARDGGENVRWVGTYCKCLDGSKDYDYKTKKCISYMEQWCNKIPGAHMMYGKCVCKATGQAVPNNGRCPPDTNGDKKGQGEKTDTAAMKSNIKAAHEKLATISNAWGRSHWKTAYGNFNGARLASDSVAGVVLGTAGGLITSNVIKKNQVRGGFEDLRCVIGGQTVADWGDQFMVGVQ